MKKITLVIVLLSVTGVVSAQKEKSTELGKTTKRELEMKVYPKDTTANALVLHEHANVYLDEEYRFVTDYYFRVKLFNKKAFGYATISIPLRKKEKISNIKAITYRIIENGFKSQTSLLQEKIFTKDINENWREVVFAMPNIKEGAVIEYVYSITSPYSVPDDWSFQSEIPKIRSDFTGLFLANYKYNISVIGFLKLNRNEASIQKRCVDIEGVGLEGGNCRMYSFGMDSIPAFKEEEYMLSKRNFISRLSFKLLSFTNIYGVEEKYTTTWETAERSIRSDFLDNQHSKKNFFKSKLPQSIYNKDLSTLQRAKKVHQFIKNHFTWNRKFWPNKKVRIKKAFDERTGNVFDINLSLYNALEAANIKSNLVLLATRDKGLPIKLFPIVSDFNYLLIKTEIQGKEYFLDATNKLLPFGVVPRNALNEEGRVMDFKKGGFWKELRSDIKTFTNIRMQLKLTPKGFEGDLIIAKQGYDALQRRKKIYNKSEEEYLDDFESKYSNVEVLSSKVVNLKNLERPIKEFFKINIEEDTDADKLRINPFFIDRIKSNPFKLKERNYPVDFGYPRKYSFMLSLEVPKKFEIKNIPENKSLKLPNKGGYFIFKSEKKEGVINVFLKLNILKKVYSEEEYYYLKELYNNFVNIQNSFIELGKK